jgi:uncharacterized protein YheU (UPF0270 family)
MINEKGIRNRPDGSVVIQHKERSEQLDNICNFIMDLLPDNGKQEVKLDAKTARTLWSYANQIGIIANEMKS